MDAGWTLWHCGACADCGKVRMALALEGLPCREVQQDQDHDGLPALRTGTERVEHANAILRTLAARPGSRLLPQSRRDQALTWVLVERADAVLGPLEDAPDRLDAELAVLDGLLDRGPYLFGDHPTVADVAVHAHLHRVERTMGRPLPHFRERVEAWFRRLSTSAPIER
jgi:glutathione S-transferase